MNAFLPGIDTHWRNLHDVREKYLRRSLIKLGAFRSGDDHYSDSLLLAVPGVAVWECACEKFGCKIPELEFLEALRALTRDESLSDEQAPWFTYRGGAFGLDEFLWSLPASLMPELK